MADFYCKRNVEYVSPKFKLANFINLPSHLLDWLSSDTPSALLLFGPSDTGKTELAKALMDARGVRSVFVRNKEGLKEFRPGFHAGIIFDDLDVELFSRKELIHLFDTANQSQVRVL